MSLIPAPYYILAPGNAVDLSKAVSVEGRAPPHRRFFLTDVSVTRASLLLLGWRLWPGVRLVPYDKVVPPGLAERDYQRLMSGAMMESQTIAAIVAERAAGYAVTVPPQSLYVAGFAPASRARAALRAGDALVRVGGIALHRVSDLARGLRGHPPGATVAVAFVRDGTPRLARVVAIGTRANPRLGLTIETRTQLPDLPVPVRYSIDGISGSSGGLMFALEIYTALRDPAPGDAVAGTGTLAADGSVGPIKGVAQKLVAAKRAGCRIFLVPSANTSDLPTVPGIRTIPVATFKEAIRALAGY